MEKSKIEWVAAVLLIFFLLGLAASAGAELGDRDQLAQLGQAVEYVESCQRPWEEWAALAQKNPGLWGWLEWPGVLDGLPVMQGKDNSYYLTHRADGARSKAGTPFLDARCTDESGVWLVYGHNMDTGEVFSPLLDLRGKKESTLTLTVQGRKSCWALCGAFRVDTTQPDAWDYAAQTEQPQAFWQGAKRHAAFGLAGEQPQGRLLALSTCTADGKGRWVLVLEQA